MIFGLWAAINMLYLIVWLLIISVIDFKEDIQENIFRKRRDFFITICSAQYGVWKNDTINKTGKLILIIGISIITLPFSIAMFLFMSIILLCKLIAFCFMKVFGATKPQWNEWWI